MQCTAYLELFSPVTNTIMPEKTTLVVVISDKVEVIDTVIKYTMVSNPPSHLLGHDSKYTIQNKTI